jgi:transposase-like protein
MMAERGTHVSHTTIMRKTAVSVRGGLHYLYRAVDKNGKSLAAVLRADPGMEARRTTSTRQ